MENKLAKPNSRSRAGVSELQPRWHVIDAEGKILGRLSSELAIILQGKHKPVYVRHQNMGDFVIVINAEKVRVTGNKMRQKVYYRHSGYHGGLKEEVMAHLLQRAPTMVIKKAVKGMLPKNALARHMLARLKVYAGPTHPHEAQVRAGDNPAGETPALTPDQVTSEEA